MHITEGIKYIGVNDHEITMFERQYPVKHGMSYNSYLICDEKNAVMDTVDIHFTEQWLENIERELGNTAPDFLIIQHMEPDHSAGIALFMEKYKDALIVAGAKAFAMLQQFFGTDYANRKIVVKEGDLLCLGQHTLAFLEAPMIHWPEVIMTFEQHTGTLFSADAFGKFGALDVDEEWTSEARRYYINIVGKYGMQVNRLLQKASSLPMQRICSLHGPILEAPLDNYLKLYQTWASYQPESQGVLLVYSSMYGNTEGAVVKLAEILQESSPTKLLLRDITKCDLSAVVSEAFQYDRLVLATTTYNNGIFPRMREFITQLTEHNFQNRRIGLIENGSWAPVAAKVMKSMLEGCKNLTFCEPVVTLHSALNDNSLAQLSALAQNLKEPTAL